MRVVHVITGLPVGGAQMMLYKLLGSRDRNDFEAEVVSLRDRGAMGDRIAALGVPVRALDMHTPAGALTAIFRLARWLRAGPAPIIQTWMYHADLVGGVAARMAGNDRVVWGIRQSNLDPRGTKRSTLRVARLCARLSRRIPSRIVCCSEAAKRTHAALGYAPERMVVIPNGFDLDVFRPDPDARASVRDELGLPTEAPLVGLVGRFDPQKDHRTFVRAAARVDPPGTHFLLCGEGVTPANAALAGWIADAGLGERCHLLGERADVPRLTAALDVAVSASFGEGFANAVGEAMASAVPCAVTDAGDSAELVGDTGRVVEPESPEALGGAISSLLAADRNERRRLGAEARQRIAERYSLAAIAERYAGLYRELAVP